MTGTISNSTAFTTSANSKAIVNRDQVRSNVASIAITLSSNVSARQQILSNQIFKGQSFPRLFAGVFSGYTIISELRCLAHMILPRAWERFTPELSLCLNIHNLLTSTSIHRASGSKPVVVGAWIVLLFGVDQYLCLCKTRRLPVQRRLSVEQLH